MTASSDTGYAFELPLLPSEDRRLQAWAEATPGATWDVSGGHVTLARFTGSLAPDALLPALHDACEGLRPIHVALTQPAREAYWDKPGLEIVMLVGASEAGVAGVLDARERLLVSMLPRGVALLEPGEYLPHLTLTTGLPPDEALRLESAARPLDLRFTATELVYWSGGETPDPESPADPPWHVVERVSLR